MLCPRNSLVVLKLHQVDEKKAGAIVIPAAKECFCEATVVAFGPGTIAAGGGVSEMADLEVGQRVLVKHRELGRGQVQGSVVANLVGIEYKVDGKTFHCFEQGNVLLILASPSDNPDFPIKVTLPDRPAPEITN